MSGKFIRFYDDLSNDEENKSTSNKRSLFDNLGSTFDANVAGYKRSEANRDMWNKIDLLEVTSDPTEREKLLNEISSLYDEREKYSNIFNTNQKLLDNDGSISGRLLGDLTQFGNSARGTAYGVLGGLASVKFGNTASYLGNEAAAHENAKMNELEAKENALMEGGTYEQAKEAGNQTYLKNMLMQQGEVALESALFGKLGNTMASGAGHVAGKVGLNGVAKSLKGAKAPLYNFDFGSKVSTKLAKQGVSKPVAEGAGVLVNALNRGIMENYEETGEDYTINREVAKALNKPDSEYSVKGYFDYRNSPEGKKSGESAFVLSLVTDLLFGGLSHGQMILEGYKNERASNYGEKLAELFDTDEFKGRVNNDTFEEVRREMANIYDIKNPEELKMKDVARMFVDYATRDYQGVEGVDQDLVHRVAANDFINTITGEKQNRIDFTGKTSEEILGKYNDLDGLNKDRASYENAQRQARKQQLEEQQNIQDAEFRDAPEVNNKENVKYKTRNKVEGELVSGLNSTKSYTDMRKETNNAEINSEEQEVVPEKIGKFESIHEDVEGYNNRIYPAGDKTIRVDYRNGLFFVSDVDKPEVPARGLSSLDEVEELLTGIENNTASISEERFAKKGRTKKESRPKGDGVISDKNVKAEPVTESDKQARRIYSTKDLSDYYESMLGTEDEMSKGLYFQLARTMRNLGMTGNNVGIELRLGEKGYTDSSKKERIYGKATFNVDKNTGVTNALITLYQGADTTTAVHELAHVGYNHLSDEDKRTFNLWAKQTELEFVSRVLNLPKEMRDIEVLKRLSKDKNSNFWKLVQESSVLNQTIDLLNENSTPDQIQQACEERFAHEFSMWYAEGYTKGVKPKNVIERILQKVCLSLANELKLVSSTSKFLKNNSYERYQYRDSDRKSPAAMFENMSVTTPAQETITVDSEPINNTETQLLEQQTTQGNEQSQQEQQQLEQQQRTVEEPVSQQQTVEQTVEETPQQQEAQQQEQTVNKGQEQETTEDMERNDTGLFKISDSIAMKLYKMAIGGNETAKARFEQLPDEQRVRIIDEYSNLPNNQEQQLTTKQIMTQLQELQEIIKETVDDIALSIVDKNNGDVDKIKQDILDAYRQAEQRSNKQSLTNIIKEIGRLAIEKARKQMQKNTALNPGVRGYSENTLQAKPLPITSQQGMFTNPLQTNTLPINTQQGVFTNPLQQENDRLRSQSEAVGRAKETIEKENKKKQEEEEKKNQLKKEITDAISKTQERLDKVTAMANKQLMTRDEWAGLIKKALAELVDKIGNTEEGRKEYDNFVRSLGSDALNEVYDICCRENIIRRDKTKNVENKEDFLSAFNKEKEEMIKSSKIFPEDSVLYGKYIVESLQDVNMFFNNKYLYENVDNIENLADKIKKQARNKQNKQLTKHIEKADAEIRRFGKESREIFEQIKDFYSTLSNGKFDTIVNDLIEKGEKRIESSNNAMAKKMKEVDDIINEQKDIEKDAIAGLKGLSEEAVLVYNKVLNDIKQNQNLDSKISALDSAVIFARMCEKIARDYRDNGEVMDALDVYEALIIEVNQKKSKGNGGIGWHDYVNSIISLTRSSYKSTFLHEAAHFYDHQLEKLARRFKDSLARKDYDILNEWAEWDENKNYNFDDFIYGNRMRDFDKKIKNALEKGNYELANKVKREFRAEMIAHGFEQYLTEGKAESTGLKNIFARFARWMKEMLFSFDNYGPGLSNDVRQVFDRMMLTDELLTGEKTKDYERKERSNFKEEYFGDLLKTKDSKVQEKLKKAQRNAVELYNTIKNIKIGFKNGNYDFNEDIDVQKADGEMGIGYKLHDLFRQDFAGTGDPDTGLFIYNPEREMKYVLDAEYYKNLGMNEGKAKELTNKLAEEMRDLFNIVYDKIVDNNKENKFFNSNENIMEQYKKLDEIIKPINWIARSEDLSDYTIKNLNDGYLISEIKSLKENANPEHVASRINKLYSDIIKRLNIKGINILNIAQEKQETFMKNLIDVGVPKEFVNKEIKSGETRVLLSNIVDLDKAIDNINKAIETDKELSKEYGILKDTGIEAMKKYLSAVDKIMEDKNLSDKEKEEVNKIKEKYSDVTEQKQTEKKKRIQLRSAVSKLTSQEDVVEYVRNGIEKIGKEDFDEHAVLEGIRNATEVLKEYSKFKVHGTPKTAQELFAHLLLKKYPNYLYELVKKVQNKSTVNDQQNRAFFAELGRRLTDMVKEKQEYSNATEDEMKNTADTIIEDVLELYLAGNKEQREYKKTQEVEEKRAKEEEEVDKSIFPKEMGDRLKELMKKKKENGSLTTLENRDLKNLMARYKIYKEKLEQQLAKQNNAKMKEKNETTKRYMKKPITDRKITEPMDKLYKQQFYMSGMKRGFSQDRIKNAFEVVNKIKKEFTRGSMGTFNNNLLYLNPKDEKKYGNAVFDFAILNKDTNDKLWDMNLYDRDNKLVYKKNMVRNFDGGWIEEISDRNATLNTDQLEKDYNTNGGLVDKEYELGDIMKHDLLYSKVNGLEDIPVKFIDNKMIKSGLVDGLEKNDLDFVGLYVPYGRKIFINVDNLELKVSGKQEMYKELLPTLIHETQHAVQYLNRYVSPKANLVNALVLHSKLEDVIKYVRKFGDKNVATLAEKELHNTDSIFKLLEREKKSSIKATEKQLLGLLDDYLDKNEFYFADLDEIEAYDTEQRFKSGNELATPFSQAGYEYDGETYDMPTALTKGEGTIIRKQMGSQQQRAEQAEQILNKAFPNVRFQYAWHSTPHDFDTFTLDHLLEGEGSMAHGWGLYFAKSLLKDYDYFKKFNKGPTLRKQGDVTINGVSIKDEVMKIFDDFRDFEEFAYNYDINNASDFINFLKDRKESNQTLLGFLKNPELRKTLFSTRNDQDLENEIYDMERENSGIDKIIHMIDNGKIAFKMENVTEDIKGKLILANIPDDKFLLKDTDDIYGKIDIVDYYGQNDYIQQKLRNLVQKEFGVAKDNVEQWIDLNTYGFWGGRIYSALSDRFKKEFTYDKKTGQYTNKNTGAILPITTKEENYKEVTSRMLNKYGINGILYHGQIDGECVVVFDNKATDIINKFKKEEGKWKNITPNIKTEYKKEGNRWVPEKSVVNETKDNVRYMKARMSKQEKLDAIKNNEVVKEFNTAYSVTFTKSAQEDAENRKKMKYFESEKNYWKRTYNKANKDVTYTRIKPLAHQQGVYTYNGHTDVVKTEKTPEWKVRYRNLKIKAFKNAFNTNIALFYNAADVGKQDAYEKFSVFSQQGLLAGTYLEKGFEYTGEEINGIIKKGEKIEPLRSVEDVIPIDKQKDFFEYCEAHRILDFEIFRPETVLKITADDARDIIKKVKASNNYKLFEDARKKFVKYNIAMFHKTLVEGEMYTELAFKEIVEKDPNYVPLSKVMDDDIDFGYKSAARIKKSFANVTCPVKRLKGSKREVINLFKQMEDRTVEYAEVSAHNRAALVAVREIAGGLDKMANGDIIARGQSMLRRVKVDERNNSVVNKPDASRGIFYVYNHGKKEFYQTGDKEFFAAITNMNEIQLNTVNVVLKTLLEGMQKVAKGLTYFSTITPDFIAVNAVRDSENGWFSSESGFIPIWDTVWGAYLMYRNTPLYQRYLALVGEYGTTNRKNMLLNDDNTYKYKKENGGIFSWFDTLGKYVEQGPRIAIFKNNLMGYNGLFDRLTSKNRKEMGNDVNASYYALNDTINFGQHGAIGGLFNKYTPFINAHLQGLYKFGNLLDLALSGHDSMNRKNPRLQKEAWFKIALHTCFTIALVSAGIGIAKYEDVPDWEKKISYVFPDGSKIPKGELFGIYFGNVVETICRAAFKDEKVKYGKLLKDIVENFVPNNIAPTLFHIAYQVAMNKDTFRDKEITPERMKRLPATMQSDEYTSKTALAIAWAFEKIFGEEYSRYFGAKRLDFLLNSYFSNTKKYIDKSFDYAYDTTMTDKEKYMPNPLSIVQDRFHIHENQSKVLADFKDEYEELKAKQEIAKQKKIRPTVQSMRTWSKFEDANKQINKLTKQMKEIEKNPRFTDTQKEEKIKQLNEKRKTVASWALKLLK